MNLLVPAALWLAMSAAPPAPDARPAWEPPQLVVSAPPDYPTEAAAAGEQGDVVMRLSVDAEGQVSEVVVVKAPSTRLARASADAALRFRFVPAHRGLRVERAIVGYVFHFSLS